MHIVLVLITLSWLLFGELYLSSISNLFISAVNGQTRKLMRLELLELSQIMDQRTTLCVCEGDWMRQTERETFDCSLASSVWLRKEMISQPVTLYAWFGWTRKKRHMTRCNEHSRVCAAIFLFSTIKEYVEGDRQYVNSMRIRTKSGGKDRERWCRKKKSRHMRHTEWMDWQTA